MSPILVRCGLRALHRRPWQPLLACLGIAAGVAGVSAIDLAIGSTRTELQHATTSLAARATHRISGGRAGVPTALYVRLRVEHGVHGATPFVSGVLYLSDEPERRIRILGIDPLAGGPATSGLAGLRLGQVALGRFLTRADAALLPPEHRRSNRLSVATAQGVRTLRSAAGDAGSGVANLAITDIATAQGLLGRRGRLDYVDLHIEPGDEGAAAHIASLLPPGVALRPLAAGGGGAERLSAAFELNLKALSLLALAVGIFLIYNAMSVSVVSRRGTFGMLRALGTSRGEIFTLVMLEASALGAAGTALGLGLGLWLGEALLGQVAQTVEDHYDSVVAGALTVAPWTLAKAATLGMGAALAAAAVPALDATRASPGAVLRRSRLERRRRRHARLLAVLGLAALAAAAAILRLSSSTTAALVAASTAMVGAAALVPGLVAATSRLCLPSGAGRMGLAARMALRNLRRHLSRTGPLMAAMLLAFAASAGIGMMVQSFRSGVAVWLEDLLGADLYVSSAAPGREVIDPRVLGRLRAMPGVAALSTYRHHEAHVGGRPVRVTGVALAPASKAGYRLVAAHPGSTWTALEEGGAVLISEPLARRMGLAAGDSLRLDTAAGDHRFPVSGVFLDYGSEHGRVLVHRDTFRRHWDDPGPRSVAVFAAGGTSLADLRARIHAELEPLQALHARGHRELRERALEVFDRTFATTQVLRAIAVIVAFAGTAGAMAALMLDRARELAILRALGMTPAETGALIAGEAVLLGGLAGLAACPAGIGLAAMLVFEIQPRAFGWSMPFEVDPSLLAQTVLLCLGAALAASLYPIWRASRRSPAGALRLE